MTLSDVKPLQCQKIFYDMADQGYRTSTIYQARIALYNMFEYAKENEVLRSNPCKKSVKSDMGKPSEKKVALTRDIQKNIFYNMQKIKAMKISIVLYYKPDCEQANW